MSTENAIAELPRMSPPKRYEATAVLDPIPLLDTARFEHMQRISAVMANCGLIPQALRAEDYQTTLANCFMVVNQAVRWNMDPFAVAQCVSVVHGKLCYEGKLVAAVVEAKLGIRLSFQWDDKLGDAMGIVVSGHFPNEPEPRTVSGTVGLWKTTGNNSPWQKQPKLQLAYRGSREWCRLHAPGLMLGVYSDDELADLSDSARARRASDVTPKLTLSERLDAIASSPPSQPEETPAEPEASTAEPATETEPTLPLAETESVPSIDAVIAEGGEAYRKGIQRRAVPGIYRTAQRATEAEAWQAGWDAAKAEDDARASG